MQIPGLLVEYLINGAVALIWLLPLAASLGLIPDKTDSLINATLLLVPGLYVLGMIIDSAASLMVTPHKKIIRKRIYKKLGIPEKEWQKFSGFSIEAKLILYAPELANAGARRSTRDRIARSSIVNFMVATVVFFVHGFGQNNDWFTLVLYLIGGAILILFCWGIWARFQFVSDNFEIVAIQILEEKIKNEHDKTYRKAKSRKLPIITEETE